ncbi:MAG: alkaline phosphatase family protein [Myxococcota bacterium]
MVGLDCASPELVFDRFATEMPFLESIRASGTWGPLRSTDPPITVPAWACMTSGRDPGELGLYGFRNRIPSSYGWRMAEARDVRVKSVFDHLSNAGRRVASLFVPLTHPAPPLRGCSISGFLTPERSNAWTFPRRLSSELTARHGSYRADLIEFRGVAFPEACRNLHAMADQHFSIAHELFSEFTPDLMMMVEIGPDRLHHCGYHLFDPESPSYSEEHEELARDYYRALDRRIEQLAGNYPSNASIIIVSDHGAQAMRGGICINDWLCEHGYLFLKRDPPKIPQRLGVDDIDWSKTKAFGEGGYYARICLNIEGREPKGIIPASRFELVRDRLAKELSSWCMSEGLSAPLITRPEQHYRTARGFPPDLMVYFEDLAFRSLGTVGHPKLIASENDLAPDGCNHAWNGIGILNDNATRYPTQGELREGMHLYDITPTLLSLQSIEPPKGILGSDLSALPSTDSDAPISEPSGGLHSNVHW